MRRAHGRLQCWGQRLARAELRTRGKDFTDVNCQVHQTAVNMPHQPTKLTQTTSIMEHSWPDTINVSNCAKQVHQPQHNHGQTNHGLKQINHGKVIGTILVRDIHYKRIIHRRQMATTDTAGERHDSLHTYSKQFVSFCCSCESFISSVSERARESFTALASAKQNPVPCSGLIARTLDDNNADVDCRAVPPPEHQAGGDSKRENRCQQDSERVNKTTPGASSSRQLEAAGGSSSRRLVPEDFVKWKEKSSSSKYCWRKVHQKVRPSCEDL